ncbi:GPI-anchored surface protein, putative [Bodo saltans]|uniref:GPI-anchored surface protein, putative n=1 Tax=Bodo saltans TaxID=75058 RepID=A0A0S4JHU4_BODSA|nr:GPI-anchored surface protein, putative [Bodo saltans]|eukprot:CUG90088.1 GPI-anchored surface protein, putative [Bodo saltans]
MPPASFVALYPKCFANFRSTVGHVTFTLLWWLLFSAVIVFIHGATTMSFIEIPCDVNMINITTTMASNTTYLITNCTLDGLPPTFDGGWMPPIHRFEAMLSTVAPPSSLMNVRIMVQGGNVLPIIKIWPAVGIAGPVSTLLSVINVSVELVNISVEWPATIAPNVVDSIFAVLFAYMRNISLTLRDCSLELHYPSSLVMNSNPILLWILGPLLLLSDDSGTTINMTSSGVSLFVAASRVVIHSQRNTTPSRLFLLEMLAGGVLTNVTILVTQQSTVTILASIWFHLQTVAVMGVQYQRNAGFIAADSQMSHVNFRVSDRSIITLVGILPLEGTTPINDTDVTLMCMQVSSCSDIYVGVEGASFLNMTLVRSTVGEASLMAMTVRRHRATIARFDVAQTAQHVRLVCRNSTTLLRAATKAILFAISAQFMVDVNATISHAVTTQEATAGLAGQQGKVATCVTLSSGVTSTEFGSTPIGIQGSVIHVEHTRIHVVVAADGALNSAISTVYLASDNVFTETGIFVDNVTMVSSVVGSTLSPFMFGAAPLSISVLLFTSTCTLVWLSGNVTAAAVDVQQSRLETAQQFLVVGFSATQLTASVVSILFVPGAVASSTIVITDCNVVMTVVTGAEDDGRGAFGANPPLPAGSTQGWNGNMVNIIATMTQRAASKMINAAPSVLTAFLSSASNATSLFDRVLIVMSRVVISPSTLPKNPSFLGQSVSVIVSMLGLADTTLRNVVVNMTNVSVFSTTATELGAVSDMRSCTRQNITALGFGHGFASLISILGQCTMASNTTVVVNGAAGVMGPAISGYSVTQNAAALTL